MKSLLEKMLDEMPEPIADLIDFGDYKKDIAIASHIVDEAGNEDTKERFFCALVEEYSEDNKNPFNLREIALGVGNKSISKALAYDCIMQQLYTEFEYDVRDRIAAYNDA